MFNYYAHTPVDEPTGLLQILVQQLPLPVQGLPGPCLHLPAWTVPGPQQVSFLGSKQVSHVPPPVPQALFEVPVWQVSVVPVRWQQPLGQLAFVHTHLPFLHSVPSGQVWQVTPPVPQASFEVPGWQVEMEVVSVVWQQPLGQLVEHGASTHEPLSQTVSFGQVWHIPPPVPQALFAVPATHPPLSSQQPFGQVSRPQRPPWHTPPTHATPGAHWLWQLPQCASFFSMLTHLPPQQRSFSSHRLPQLPQ
jgi:hypothetical protein